MQEKRWTKTKNPDKKTYSIFLKKPFFPEKQKNGEPWKEIISRVQEAFFFSE